nr:hypothetical protein Iba_chr14bCG3640 [Ipomoea batatas]
MQKGILEGLKKQTSWVFLYSDENPANFKRILDSGQFIATAKEVVNLVSPPLRPYGLRLKLNSTVAIQCSSGALSFIHRFVPAYSTRFLGSSDPDPIGPFMLSSAVPAILSRHRCLPFRTQAPFQATSSYPLSFV